MRLVASKPFKYATRHLRAGEEFNADARYVQTLLLTGLARCTQDDSEPLADLRRTAARLGICVDGRWGARRLKAEIAHRMGS